MNSWINIITFTLPHEANFAKSVLESEGINTIIQNELTAQVNNFYSNAIGGVQLLVSKDDAVKAYNILKDGGFISEAEQKKIEKIKEAEKMNTICPYCNSDNIVKKGTPGYILILSIFLLGLPLPFLRTTYYCFNCDKEWKI